MSDETAFQVGFFFSPLFSNLVSYSLLNIYLHACFLKIALVLITLLSNFQDHLG